MGGANSKENQKGWFFVIEALTQFFSLAFLNNLQEIIAQTN
jgi:hypothetical protein